MPRHVVPGIATLASLVGWGATGEPNGMNSGTLPEPLKLRTKSSTPLFCRFLPMQSVFDRDLLIQLLVGHTPLHKNLLTSSRLGVWPVSQPLR